MKLTKSLVQRIRRFFSRPIDRRPPETPQHVRAQFESETFGRQGGYG